MDLGRAGKFGSIGAVGVILIALGTVGLMAVAWNNRTSGFEGIAASTLMLVAIGGTAMTVVFLFVVIGAYFDRELEARGLTSPEE